MEPISTGTAISVLVQGSDAEVVTLPFEFELEVTGGSERLHSVHGTPCDVKGYITLDTSNLSSTVEAKLRGDTEEDICMQAALVGVGHNPGVIDGKDGKDTRAAENAFRTKKGLQGIDRHTPEFSSALIKALRGH